MNAPRRTLHHLLVIRKTTAVTVSTYCAVLFNTEILSALQHAKLYRNVKLYVFFKQTQEIFIARRWLSANRTAAMRRDALVPFQSNSLVIECNNTARWLSSLELSQWCLRIETSLSNYVLGKFHFSSTTAVQSHYFQERLRPAQQIKSRDRDSSGILQFLHLETTVLKHH